MQLTAGLALAAGLLFAGTAAAQARPAPLAAAASDPRALGWMQGFPPPAAKIIRFTDPDYFGFPKLRWTVCHFRELMPTVAVDRGSEAAAALPRALDPAIERLRFTPLGGGQALGWDEAFGANHTDGLLVLHHGRIVYERYAGCLGERSLHGAMSLTKSITGLLGEMLVAEGALDENARVDRLVPELKESAFGDATVRQLLDMTTGLAYSEDYADPKAEVWAHAQAGSPLPKPEGYSGPRSYFEYLQTVRKQGEHGAAFGYKTVNTDALGWVLARVSGQPVNALLADRLWRRLGAEREAFYTVDSIGTPFAGGGFNATLRDLARLGQLLLDEGEVNGRPLVPAAAIARLRRGGDPAKFAQAGYAQLPGWSYGSMWWHSHDAHGAFGARGVHGQTLWIDPRADMVVARFASHPVAANAANDPTSLPAWRALAEHLIANDASPLLGRAWRVEDVAGQGVVDDARPALRFHAYGRLSGSAGCNRILGRYESEGSTLRVMPAGSTMMACAPTLLAQEDRLLKLLPRIDRYELDAGGVLRLFTGAGAAIVARR